MKAYKGFNKDMTCRGFQFEEGKTYEETEAKLCEKGFHACEDPLNVMDYYSPADGSIYREVEIDDVSNDRSDDSKIVAKKITIGAEIGIPGLVKAHIERITQTVKKDAAQIGSSGYAAKIGSSGRYAKIGSSGDDAKIGSSGYAAQIGSSGDDAKIGSSGRYAQIGSSGRYAQIGSSGDDAKIECSADHAVIVCAGKRGRIKAPIGTWITLAEYGEYDGVGVPCKCLKSAIVDGETIKSDTWYKLENGEFVEVTGND